MSLRLRTLRRSSVRKASDISAGSSRSLTGYRTLLKILKVFVFLYTHSVRFENNLTAYAAMKISNHSAVPVYTISGSSTARPLPEWLARKRKRSLKNDPEYASRIELLQDFEFDESSQCVRVSDDGQWVMSTGTSSTALYACSLPCL